MLVKDLYAALQWPGLKSSWSHGWLNRSYRPLKGVRSVVIHHTAGRTDSGDLRVVIDGRPDLRGPLCNVLVLSNGDARVIAAGRTNHAGRVYDQKYGNSYSIGVEAVHNGRDPWPPHLYNAMVRTAAALCLQYGLKATDVKGHKEISKPRGRKTDPNFDMHAFRLRVADEMKRVVKPGDRMVLLGSRGGDVAFLQRHLGTEPDGVFGPHTEAAVKQWQVSQGLAGDGMVGKVTWGKIVAPEPPVEKPEPVADPELQYAYRLEEMRNAFKDMHLVAARELQQELGKNMTDLFDKFAKRIREQMEE